MFARLGPALQRIPVLRKHSGGEADAFRDVRAIGIRARGFRSCAS
jgi:hypothetical protein